MMFLLILACSILEFCQVHANNLTNLTSGTLNDVMIPSPIIIIIPSVLLGVPTVLIGCVCCKSIICKSLKSKEVNIHKLKEERKRQRYNKPSDRSQAFLQTSRSPSLLYSQASSRRNSEDSVFQPSNQTHYIQNRENITSRPSNNLHVQDLDQPGGQSRNHHRSKPVEARLAERKRKHRLKKQEMQVEANGGNGCNVRDMQLHPNWTSQYSNLTNSKHKQSNTPIHKRGYVSDDYKSVNYGKRKHGRNNSASSYNSSSYGSGTDRGGGMSPVDRYGLSSPDSYDSAGNRSTAPSYIEVEQYSAEASVHTTGKELLHV